MTLSAKRSGVTYVL